MLAARPVTRDSYRRYLHDTGRPLPHVLMLSAPPTDPITDVAQVDAAAYCRWLSAREARDCHLPTMAELEELNGELAERESGLEAWPHSKVI